MREYKLSPSIYAADFGALREQIKLLEDSGVELLHCDVMDGHFVYNMGFGPAHIKMIKQMTKLPLDVHLMIERPERMLDQFIDAGADIIMFHQESTNRLYSCLEKTRLAGRKAGVVLCPATSIETVRYCLDQCDMILQMTINPGEDSPFHPATLDKIRDLKKMIGDRDIDIEVDGGVTEKNIKLVRDAGANVFVSGGGVFKGDVAANIARLREELKG